MARTYARVVLGIWHDPDFTGMDRTAQWLYLLLLSQRGTSTCGVQTYAPNRWASLSAGTRPKQILDALAVLEERRFVVVDRDTDELAIRSHLRHDRTLRTVNTAKAVARSWQLIRSAHVRKAVLIELQRLYDDGRHDDLVGWQVPEIKALVAMDLRSVR